MTPGLSNSCLRGVLIDPILTCPLSKLVDITVLEGRCHHPWCDSVVLTPNVHLAPVGIEVSQELKYGVLRPCAEWMGC